MGQGRLSDVSLIAVDEILEMRQARLGCELSVDAYLAGIESGPAGRGRADHVIAVESRTARERVGGPIGDLIRALETLRQFGRDALPSRGFRGLVRGAGQALDSEIDCRVLSREGFRQAGREPLLGPGVARGDGRDLNPLLLQLFFPEYDRGG